MVQKVSIDVGVVGQEVSIDVGVVGQEVSIDVGVVGQEVSIDVGVVGQEVSGDVGIVVQEVSIDVGVVGQEVSIDVGVMRQEVSIVLALCVSRLVSWAFKLAWVDREDTVVSTLGPTTSCVIDWSFPVSQSLFISLMVSKVSRMARSTYQITAAMT